MIYCAVVFDNDVGVHMENVTEYAAKGHMLKLTIWLQLNHCLYEG